MTWPCTHAGCTRESLGDLCCPLQLRSHPRTQLDILDTGRTNFASVSLLPQYSESLPAAKRLRANPVSSSAIGQSGPSPEIGWQA